MLAATAGGGNEVGEAGGELYIGNSCCDAEPRRTREGRMELNNDMLSSSGREIYWRYMVFWLYS
jgi:hypothetical protein